DEVVEVEATRAPQQLVVAHVDPAHHLVEVVAAGISVRSDQLVLGVADLGGDHARRIALLVQAQLLEDAPDGGPGVVVVEDHEGAVLPGGRAKPREPSRGPSLSVTSLHSPGWAATPSSAATGSFTRSRPSSPHRSTWTRCWAG